MCPVLSIVLADDHPVILMGLAAAIGQFPQQQVVAQAHDERELMQVHEKIEKARAGENELRLQVAAATKAREVLSGPLPLRKTGTL